MDLKQEITEILKTNHDDKTDEQVAELIIAKFLECFKE